MKRALTGAILIHAAAIVFAATILKDRSTPDFGYFAGSFFAFLGFGALIAAAIKKDTDPKD